MPINVREVKYGHDHNMNNDIPSRNINYQENKTDMQKSRLNHLSTSYRKISLETKHEDNERN